MSTIFFEDLTVGAVEWGPPLVADREEMLAYGRAFDPWPFHVDELAAAASPFGGLIASGGYTFGLLFRSIHAMYNRPDRTSAFLGALEWKVRFANPVRAGEQLRDKVTILETQESRDRSRGVVTVLHELINQNDDVALSVTAVVLQARRPPQQD